jgi:hypothetical protein
MFRRKRSASDIAVPQNVYRHSQAGFAESNAQRCVEYEGNRIFHPGDAFIDVLRWLWGGIEGGEMRVTPIDGPSRLLPSQERVLRARSWLTTSPLSTPSSQSRSRLRRR